MYVRQLGLRWYLTAVAVGLALMAVIAALVLAGPMVAAAFTTLLIPFIFPFPKLFIALTAVALPLSASLAVQVGGSFVAGCDVLALLSVAAYLAAGIYSDDPNKTKRTIGGITRPYKVIGILAFPYFLIATFNATFTEPNIPEFLSIAQRIVLVFLWLAFGSVIYQIGLLDTFIKWFVTTNVVVCLAWIATPGADGVFGVQKNPSGGFIAAAFLITLLSKLRNQVRIPLILLLTAGLVSTGSRGSMLGLAIAVVFLVVFARQGKRVIVPAFFASLAVGAALVVLPDEVTARILSQDNAGVYNIDIRQVFIDDAMRQFAENPWEGVGVGNYVQINPMLSRIATHDPHNVFVLSLTEGGYLLFAGFVLLTAGSVIWLLKQPKTPDVVIAMGVQASTLAHAYFDVYWVRGTPSVGWLLVGSAAAAIIAAKKQTPHTDQPVARAVPNSRVRALSQLTRSLR